MTFTTDALTGHSRYAFSARTESWRKNTLPMMTLWFFSRPPSFYRVTHGEKRPPGCIWKCQLYLRRFSLSLISSLPSSHFGLIDRPEIMQRFQFLSGLQNHEQANHAKKDFRTFGSFGSVIITTSNNNFYLASLVRASPLQGDLISHYNSVGIAWFWSLCDVHQIFNSVHVTF